ncbi:hypothetical protein SUGI_1022550 [Cryptomeria japonica]|nr:hypothetical protein SUGI_1022550 [Cryptomeria japonica]
MMEMRKWVSENKLTSVGALWSSTLGVSLAYNFSKPAMKTSLKLIHARIHAQGITLAALSAAALLHLHEQNAQQKLKQNHGIA